ncbi:MAG: hypothetical protein IKO55_18075 [Kiritimatiellae bacterium]|nr:hypothetical protein [Kiritimatiellia bacterium]
MRETAHVDPRRNSGKAHQASGWKMPAQGLSGGWNTSSTFAIWPTISCSSTFQDADGHPGQMTLAL